MTTTTEPPVLRQCHGTSDVPAGPHGPHGWHGRICPGLGLIDALTLPQIEVIAERLGMRPSELMLSLLRDDEAES